MNHEIDSAYWNEWKLFKLPGGISGFLWFHFITIPPVLYGLVLVSRNDPLGLIFSLVVALTGIFAFGIHMYFIKKGKDEFNVPMSLAILVATLVISVIQIIVTLQLMA
jgi:hypothetical protein